MKKISRRQFGRSALAVLSAPMTLTGCNPQLVILVLAWIVVLSQTGTAVLQAKEASWKVEAAKLDVTKKQLELQGIRNGQNVSGRVQLTDIQFEAVQKNNKLEIQFTDGTTELRAKK